MLAEGYVPEGSSGVTIKFTVPEARYGVNYVQYMRVGCDERINIQFIVKPSLLVSTTSATPGTAVTVKGTGFPANDIGTLTLGSKSSEKVISTNELGSFTTTFTIPSTTTGEHEFMAITQDMYSGAATATIKVLPATNPEPEPPEATTETPIIEPEPPETTVETPPTEPDGNTTIDISQDIEPPPCPKTVTPMGHSFGMVGARRVTFDWTEVSDPSDVIYTLEVSESHDFSSAEPTIQKTDLTRTTYSNYIEPGIYFWRVKAIDGAGNESHWTYAPRPFKVGEFSILLSNFAEFLKVGMEFVAEAKSKF